MRSSPRSRRASRPTRSCTGPSSTTPLATRCPRAACRLVRSRFIPLACAVALAAQAAFSRAGDATRGRQLYESRCGGCHSLDENRAGPAHCGVFGRKAGSAAGYEYSPALKSSRVVWNEKSLDRWLADPEALIPGQRMGFSLPDATDRTDVVTYLRVLKPCTPR